MAKDKVGINYGAPMKEYFDNIKQVLVQQEDFRGIGGHRTLTPRINNMP